MAQTTNIEAVATKFQTWAETLPADEQAALASWMTQVGGPEIQGYAQQWYTAPDAYYNCFMECC
jgi:hypothetical protein